LDDSMSKSSLVGDDEWMFLFSSLSIFSS
jgi:hypothetical protein